MTLRWLRILTLVGSLAVLAGCGGSGGSAQTAQGAGSILNHIIQSKQLRVGVVNDNPPYSSAGTDGNLQGYDIDIVNGIAGALSAKPDFVRVDAPGRISGLQTGKLDMTVADFSITPGRALVIDFSQPYLVVHNVLLVPMDSKLNAIGDANQAGVKIATPRGGTSTDQLNANFGKAQILVLSSLADVKQALESGQADAAVFDDVSVGGYMKDHAGKYKVLSGYLSGGDRIGIGVPKGDFEWTRWIDAWVSQFNFSGQNASSFQKWFGAPLPPLTS